MKKNHGKLGFKEMQLGEVIIMSVDTGSLSDNWTF